MNLKDRSLVRKLAVVLVLKLVLLTGLWWGFVRDQRVAVNADAATTHLLGPHPAAVSTSVQE